MLDDVFMLLEGLRNVANDETDKKMAGNIAYYVNKLYGLTEEIQVRFSECEDTKIENENLKAIIKHYLSDLSYEEKQHIRIKYGIYLL